MGDISMSAEMRSNYEAYYQGESTWRLLGAIDKASNIFALCARYPHSMILEIGCGEGSVLKRLSDLRFGERLYGLEVSTSAVHATLGRAIDTLVECRLFDGYSVPYADGGFDLAILSHVVEHVEHPRRLLYEAARVSRRVFIEVPLEDNLRLKNDFTPDRTGHINVYSRKTMRWLVQSCGLKALSEMTTNPSRGTYSYRLGRRGLPAYFIKEVALLIAPDLARRLFTYHYSLLCERSTISV